MSDGVPRRSLYVALIVGTVLNLINQGDALLGMASINWLKLILTYCVPYVVCTYGAVSYRLKKADDASLNAGKPAIDQNRDSARSVRGSARLPSLNHLQHPLP